MADLVIAFSQPVSDPVLHFADVGGSFFFGANPSIRFSQEYEVLMPGVTLERMSGTTRLGVNERARSTA
ncbi:hypothetical protein [Lysobacter enzymogenes]|uniref:hypothetical protein n=1 Tax=Lysobacter enzymogenes TaxID=69 RepID=UPI00099C4173|nr:hypothetical protein [Lysobacter enzymogenes]UZW58755.1 hypothetical protein BV903_015700 [Lysobacter enzymogenes]